MAERGHLFRVATWLLFALLSSAVLAPLIANDRPYYLKGVDYRGYKAALSTLVPITRQLERHGTGAEELASEQAAARQRIETLRAWLVEEQPLLDAFESQLAGSPPRGLAESAERLQEELALDRVRLRERVSWPLFTSLGGLDVFLVGLWLLSGLSLFLPGMRTSRAWTIGLCVAALLGLLWSSLNGAPSASGRRYKAELTRGDIQASALLLPPLSYGYSEPHMAESLRPPTWTQAARSDGVPPQAQLRVGEPGWNSPSRHLLGTDSIGRDLFVRMLWGGRVSLFVGFASAFLLTLAGIVIGGAAGFFGGRVDHWISRGMEVVMAFPALFLVLLMMALTDPDVLPPVFGIVLVIAFVSWTHVARLARAEFLRMRDQDFVLAARALGFPSWRIVLFHMLPNAMGPILVAFTFAVAGGILVESTISYLGFGIDRPTPSWGALISESRSADHWWIQLFPGLAIFLTILCTHVVGDGLREALDPRAQRPSP